MRHAQVCVGRCEVSVWVSVCVCACVPECVCVYVCMSVYVSIPLVVMFKCLKLDTLIMMFVRSRVNG